MILIDTNVLLALMSRDDDNYAAAARQAPAMRDAGIVLTLPVFAELTHFSRFPQRYSKLEALMELLDIRFERSEHLIQFPEALAWLKRYASHKPDYADAHLVLLTAKHKNSKVWSFDKEFRTIWRRPDGSAVPMAVGM
jgi:predicted nucleic acid-binding protein